MYIHRAKHKNAGVISKITSKRTINSIDPF